MKAVVCLALALSVSSTTHAATGPAIGGPTLADAQHLFYNARYEAAATLMLELRASDPENLANDEMRLLGTALSAQRAARGTEREGRGQGEGARALHGVP